MGTTNILDLNNRLTKVEKKNIAQNNYNSLKNRPKINGNLLTGDKTGSQLGLADAQEIGNLSDLNTTDKSSCVGAINELKSGLINIGDIKGRSELSVNFADLVEYGNGIFSISTHEDSDAPDSNKNSYYVLQSSFYSDKSYVMQIAVSPWPDEFKVYLRKRASGTWSQWKSIELI